MRMKRAPVPQMKLTATELGVILGISKQYVGQLHKRGILQRDPDGRYDLADAVQRYAAWIQSKRKTPADQSERALLTRARRLKAELELKLFEQDLHQAADVEREMNAMVAAFRARCLAIPAKVGPQLVGQADLAVIQQTLKREIYQALADMANYEPGEPA